MSGRGIVGLVVGALAASNALTGSASGLVRTSPAPAALVASHGHSLTATEILAARPLRPTDHSLLTPAIYPDAPATVPATGSDLAVNQARQMLVAYEQVDHPGSAADRQAALDFYDNGTAAAKIPNNSLRAAAAALSGTWAAAAQFVMTAATTSGGNPLYTSVDFGTTSAPAVAMVFGAGTSDPDQLKIVFNDRYRHENPFLFTSYLAHEALHEDLQVNNIEESVNTSLDNLFAISQLARHPDLSRLGSELSRRLNVRTLERLNSGTGTTLGLYHDNRGRQVYPGSNVATEHSWWDYADTGERGTTPGNALLSSYLTNLHHGSGSACSGAMFSKALLDCIDRESNAGISSAAIVAAARAMKLDTNVGEKRSIKLRAAHGEVAGKIKSHATPCNAKQVVTVVKIRHGNAKKLRTIHSKKSGAFSAKVGKPGKYAATVKRHTVNGVGVCLAATSKTVNAKR
jgi:hypothetical protein